MHIQEMGSLASFELEDFRITADLETITTNKTLNTVPSRKPKDQEYFRSLCVDEWVFQLTSYISKTKTGEFSLFILDLLRIS